MNDCSEGNDISVEEFESNLTQLTERMAEVGAIPILQTTCPYWEGQGLDRSPFVDDIQVIRKLARSLAHPLIDHTRFWGDQNAFALMLSLSRQLDDAAHARAHPPQVIPSTLSTTVSMTAPGAVSTGAPREQKKPPQAEACEIGEAPRARRKATVAYLISRAMSRSHATSSPRQGRPVTRAVPCL